MSETYRGCAIHLRDGWYNGNNADKQEKSKCKRIFYYEIYVGDKMVMQSSVSAYNMEDALKEARWVVDNNISWISSLEG